MIVMIYIISVLLHIIWVLRNLIEKNIYWVVISSFMLGVNFTLLILEIYPPCL